MSYDLAVWSSSEQPTLESARGIYLNLCKGDTSLVERSYQGVQRISMFLTEITARYPRLDDYPEDIVDDCPWSIDFDVSEVHVILPIVWSRVPDTVPFVLKLASENQLTVYDPQADKVYASNS